MRRCFVMRLLMLGFVLLLPGCWDRREINDVAFALTTGFDLEKDGRIRLSVLSALPGQMGGPSGGGGGTGGEKSYYVDSEVGETIRDAQSKLQERMARRLFLAHSRTMLVGEDLAKQGIRPLFDANARSPENRMNAYMIVAKGKAYEMLQSSPKLERFPSEAMRELLKNHSIADMNMKDVALGLTAPGGDTVAPYMEVKESEKSPKRPSKELEIKGYAHFQGDKMIGTLENDTALGFSILRNKKVQNTATLTVEDKHPMSLHIYQTRTKTNTNIADGHLQFMIQIKARARLVENRSTYDLSQTDQLTQAESALSDYIKHAVQSVIDKSVSTNTDPVQFGEYVLRSNPAEWSNRFEPEWPNALRDAVFTVQVDSKLTDTGLIYENIAKERTGK